MHQVNVTARSMSERKKLTVATESEWQVAGPGQTNKYVYNTEAHPVKVFSAK